MPLLMLGHGFFIVPGPAPHLAGLHFMVHGGHHLFPELAALEDLHQLFQAPFGGGILSGEDDDGDEGPFDGLSRGPGLISHPCGGLRYPRRL